MKKILLMLALLMAPLTYTGCKSPQLVAYRTADAVVSSVDLAMQGWADYVVAERKRILALAPLDRGSQQADLLRKEGKVLHAYGRYQAAMRVSQSAVNAAIQDKSRLPDNVAAAAAEVLKIVRELKGA